MCILNNSPVTTYFTRATSLKTNPSTVDVQFASNTVPTRWTPGWVSNVKTFFVGGAIEISMAEEIFNQVKNGELTTAANLTNENQLSEICSWIINI